MSSFWIPGNDRARWSRRTTIFNLTSTAPAVDRALATRPSRTSPHLRSVDLLWTPRRPSKCHADWPPDLLSQSLGHAHAQHPHASFIQLPPRQKTSPRPKPSSSSTRSREPRVAFSCDSCAKMKKPCKKPLGADGSVHSSSLFFHRSVADCPASDPLTRHTLTFSLIDPIGDCVRCTNHGQRFGKPVHVRLLTSTHPSPPRPRVAHMLIPFLPFSTSPVYSAPTSAPRTESSSLATRASSSETRFRAPTSAKLSPRRPHWNMLRSCPLALSTHSTPGPLCKTFTRARPFPAHILSTPLIASSSPSCVASSRAAGATQWLARPLPRSGRQPQPRTRALTRF